MTSATEEMRRTHPMLSWGALLSTLAGIVFLLAYFWLDAQGGPHVALTGSLALGAALCIGIPPLLVAHAIYRVWYISLTAATAMAFIVLSQAFDVLYQLDPPPWLQRFALLDPNFALRAEALNFMLHMGLALLVLTFYLCLFQADRYRRNLAEKTRALSHSVAELTQSRRAVREERDQAQQYLDVAGELIARLDLDGQITLLNRSGYALLGYPEGSLEGRPFTETLLPERDRERVWDRFRAVIAGGRAPTGRFEQSLVTASGEERLVLWHNQVLLDDEGAISGMLVSGMDITEHRRQEKERRTLEERAQQAQRMESLGVLAGGIAHEFNNLFMSLQGNVELAMLEVPADSPAAERLAMVEATAQRAARLTREMLDYSGRGPLAVQPIDLSALIRGMKHLIKAATGDRIDLRLDLAEGLPKVEGDGKQLKQVIMNLVTNAAEAMSKQGNTLTLHTSAVDMTARELAVYAPRDALPAGRYVAITVRDEGIGMDGETRERAFEPFFSTHSTGRGLGLAAVQGTVRSHQGVIDLESTPGKGTCVRILLPALLSDVARTAPAPAWHGERAVLLVDDDTAVLEVASEYLEMLGIPVLTATSGDDALQVLAQSLDHVGCVVLDHQMPGLESTETRKQIDALMPGLPVLLSSGYGRDDLASRTDLSGFAGFLQKPYRSAGLVTALQELMAQDEKSNDATRC